MAGDGKSASAAKAQHPTAAAAAARLDGQWQRQMTRNGERHGSMSVPELDSISDSSSGSGKEGQEREREAKKKSREDVGTKEASLDTDP